MLTLDEGSEELEDPKGDLACNSQAEFVELDEILSACDLGDAQVSIVLKAGSAIIQAMHNMHWDMQFSKAERYCGAENQEEIQ